MAGKELKCPSCGAPLEYKSSSREPTIKCPYCESSVVVPEELRPRRAPRASSPSPAAGMPVQVPAKVTSGVASRVIGCGIAGFIVFIFLVSVVLPTAINRQNAAFQVSWATEQAGRKTSRTQTAAADPTRTPRPTVTPTPGFAYSNLTFGKEGIGEGMFSDARYIAVDGNGFVYVADYQGGRVQRFDADGKYVNQFKVGGDSKVIIAGLCASNKGDVFAAVGAKILRYNGQTGKLISTWTNPKGGTFGDMSATADGRLAAMWYEGRWGMITSLEGHREDLVVFDGDGKIVQTISSVISGQTDSLALDVAMTVDGAGKFYLLSDDVVYMYSAEGKYLNSFGSQGDQPGQFQGAMDLAVDGQGRLYVSDMQKVHVFIPGHRLIDDFPTGQSFDMIAIDRLGAIWGVARDHVSRFVLREQ